MEVQLWHVIRSRTCTLTYYDCPFVCTLMRNCRSLGRLRKMCRLTELTCPPSGQPTPVSSKRNIILWSPVLNVGELFTNANFYRTSDTKLQHVFQTVMRISWKNIQFRFRTHHASKSTLTSGCKSWIFLDSRMFRLSIREFRLCRVELDQLRIHCIIFGGSMSGNLSVYPK